MRPKFPVLKLCCIGTDSFVNYIQNVDFYYDSKYDVKEWFDTKNYTFSEGGIL